MDKKIIKDLTKTLSKVYETEALSAFSEFFTGELHALQYLSKNIERDVYPSDLSEALHVTRARIASILASLRKKGFIGMELDEKDRRRMRVSMSASGTEYLNKKQEGVRVYLVQWLERLGEENTLEFIRLLNLSMGIKS